MKERATNKGRTDIARIENIPNVGTSIARDLHRIGIMSPGDLPGCDPFEMYDALCRVKFKRSDPCVLDMFIAVVRYMEGGPKSRGGSSRLNANGW